MTAPQEKAIREALPVVAHLIEGGSAFTARALSTSDRAFAEREAADRKDGSVATPLCRLSDAEVQLAELRADAMRYRWLRDQSEWEMFEDRWLCKHDIYGQGPADMDAVIDAALAAKEPQ